MDCRKCKTQCVLRQNMFFYHDGTFFTGYVCVKCNALYDNPEDSIWVYELKYNKPRNEDKEKKEKKPSVSSNVY